LRDAKFKIPTVSTTGQQYDATFQKVEEFKHLGTTLTNQNSIQEEIKSRLKCYCVVLRIVCV